MEGTILTQAGKAELLNAPLLQKKVNWNQIAVGDSNGSGYIPSETQTELKNQLWSGTITDIREVAPGHLEFHTVIPAEVGPFIIREAGILNEDGVLVAVCPVEDQNKVSISSSSGTSNDMDFIIGILVDNAEVINVLIDPNVVLATREYVDSRLKNLALETITKPEIEEITGETIDFDVVDVDPLSSDDIARLLDNNPDNDPKFDDIDAGELSKEDLLNMLED